MSPTPESAGPSLGAYRGLGAWVDIYDRKLWKRPEATVAALAAHGTRTLFLESASYRRKGPIRFPTATWKLVEAAHAAGMRVVAWYVPDFKDLRRDLSWSLAAIGLVTPAGERFDSFALDIEATVVTDPAKRAGRMLRLSRGIRAAAGPDYPLGAIVPAPLRSPSFWPVLPLADLARIYDVLLPMAYWTGHARGGADVHTYLDASVRRVRSEAGAGVPLHVIGGLAGDAPSDEIEGFVRAVRGAGVLGASLYDAATTTTAHWEALGRLA